MEPDRLYLHRARVAAGVELDEIERRTRIAPDLLRALDRGAFDRVPGGIYTRSYIRAFACAVGLDPEATLAALAPLLPPGAALPSASSRVEGSPREGSGRHDETALRRQPATRPGRPVPGEDRKHVRADVRPAYGFPGFRVSQLDVPDWRRYVATLLDSGILAAMHVLTLGLAALAAGVSLPILIEHAGPILAVVCALTTAIYFCAFAGVLALTPGERAVGLAPPALTPVSIPELGRRAVTSFLAKGSIVVDVLCRIEPWTLWLQVRSPE